MAHPTLSPFWTSALRVVLGEGHPNVRRGVRRRRVSGDYNIRCPPSGASYARAGEPRALRCRGAPRSCLTGARCGAPRPPGCVVRLVTSLPPHPRDGGGLETTTPDDRRGAADGKADRFPAWGPPGGVVRRATWLRGMYTGAVADGRLQFPAAPSPERARTVSPFLKKAAVVR
ncbi:hypothetical protein chiPu_0023640 [Chiloscyllium punctatum]|uniref:Uncharacterized protein n=1 Tax=Chiloscyllium punctatum TaxID=137246 RepID=A0A401TAN1_CHIPU|nr:hypothetical protein [Chiloscyllium punctatum]